jgi:ceramide glucosyltransferase
VTGPLAALAFALLMTGLHLLTLALAARRVRRKRPPCPAPPDPPPVSIVRPLCGIEAFSLETLRSSFTLAYPRYELIFGVARGDDPVLGLVHRLIAAYPDVPAQLIVGDEPFSPNPKLNNVVKGWDRARHDWVIMADSNVLMPEDYVQRLLQRWRRRTGVVCSVPIGSSPANFWAELECAFLNGFEARWEYAADSVGMGYAQGKSMLMRKSIIDSNGGIRSLGAEIAEDAALTKLLDRAGLKVRLVDDAFEQPLGRRTAAEVWGRQRRWARLRRMTFPALFLPELVSGSFFPVLAFAAFSASSGRDAAAAGGLLLALWLAAEALLVWRAGWHWSARMVAAMLLRDLMLPFLWVDAWLGSSFVWRGTRMRPERAEASPAG